MNRYVVSLEGKEFNVDMSSDGVISVGGHEGTINLQHVGGDTYSVLIGNVSAQIIARSEGSNYQVLLKNNQVDVRVETERDRLLMQYATSAGDAHHRYEIHAPMPALVIRVEVSVGDEVKGGQGLVVLEAMKMENEIKSHQAGKVKEIYVVKGKAVEKGELLMLLE